MIAKVILKFIRISPRKARQVSNLLTGKRVDQALSMLFNLHKKAARYMEDALNSAYSNAKVKLQNKDLDPAQLYITKAIVDKGPTLHRFRAATMGRAMPFKHRTSHIKIELDMVPQAKNAVSVETKKAGERRKLPRLRLKDKGKTAQLKVKAGQAKKTAKKKG
ncbi:MAG: 50S ribosomal protein L22 [Candidatus Omnitrophica bacterium]|nr:50S ribosomal protein L22 [Candidatus Omnitrophota bacterium]